MDYFDQMRTLREKGQPFVLATVVRVEKPTSAKPGAKAIITQDGALTGWVGGSCSEPSVRREALKVLQEGRPILLRLCPPERMSSQAQEGVSEVKITCMSGGTLEIYLEPYPVQPHLVIIGHQAVAEALVNLAAVMDYSVTMLGEGVSRERFPTADRVVEGLDFAQIEFTPNTYVVIASHGNYDELALEAALPSPAPYVALVASKKRAASILDYLKGDSLPEELINRLKYPAGLDFGAQTPEEIALSILSEIVQVRRRGLPKAAPVSAISLEKPEEAVDPVCGMTVEVGSASLSAVYQGKSYYFCSVSCQRQFIAQPEKFLHPNLMEEEHPSG